MRHNSLVEQDGWLKTVEGPEGEEYQVADPQVLTKAVLGSFSQLKDKALRSALSHMVEMYIEQADQEGWSYWTDKFNNLEEVVEDVHLFIEILLMDAVEDYYQPEEDVF